MQVEHQHVIRVRVLHQQGSHQRALLQVEGIPRLFLDEPQCLLVANLGLRQVRQVEDLQGHAGRRMDDLDGGIAFQAEGRAEGFVAANQLVEALLERG
ncbi:hypothetical protein GCM10012319_59600 [Comamonas sp. KCTC 72670]|nr:hypothetical protein GCM10012319_59600 [Comamonas sp. KCTC 72670]